jgi:hypothetical protein
MERRDLDLKKSKKKRAFAVSLLTLFIIPFLIPLFFPTGMRNEVTLSNFIFLKCPIFKIFNVYCPTCGLGRSLCSLFLLKLSQSWAYHPGGIMLYLTLLVGAVLKFFYPKKNYKLLLFFKRIGHQKKTMRFVQFFFMISYVMWGVFREPF